jgi:hypothetical protein
VREKYFKITGKKPKILMRNFHQVPAKKPSKIVHHDFHSKVSIFPINYNDQSSILNFPENEVKVLSIYRLSMKPPFTETSIQLSRNFLIKKVAKADGFL